MTPGLGIPSTLLGQGPGVDRGAVSAGQVLHSTGRTVVLRVPRAAGGTAIRKEVHNSEGTTRLRREVAVLQRLADVPGVSEVLEVDPDGAWMLLVDHGGSSVAEQLPQGGFDAAWVVRFASTLAGVVARVHQAGVIHKDINPANLVLSGDPDRVQLIDFDVASTFAEERPGFTHHRTIVGTLPYLAPEQSGRTGRPVDHRADLYAIGATLYELLTGAPPFGTDIEDPLRMIHAHLAQAPRPPAEVKPAVPVVLSAIVLRLLQKEPDRRYQSAEGLRYDLARLQSLLVSAEETGEPGGIGQSGGTAVDFPLGERDFPVRLAAPSRLVGRDEEIAAIRDAYAGARDGVRGLLVGGPPGVGKTVLLDELRSLVTAHGGWFVSGKFDQYRQDVGTDAVVQALSALGQLLLAEPEPALLALRASLLAALGSNAGLVARLPEFATLLAVVPEEPSGEPAQIAARTYRSCVDLLRAVASPSRPVVMVLDDLQWATTFPIGLIDAVLTDGTVGGLLLVGAYRDGEVDATHPLSAVLARWERLGLAPQQLRLDNLPQTELAVLLAEMLRLAPARAAALAESVGERTAGNPFDTVELVNALRRDGVLALGGDGWSWDAAAVRRFVGNGDVVDLLSARIDRLPPGTGRLLEIMACLGGEMSVAQLAAATGVPPEETLQQLNPALEDGLLVPDAVTGSGAFVAVRFRHDRVQQAAYARQDAEARDQLHLALARQLVEVPECDGIAAEQYLRAACTLVEPAELRRAATLFLAAATNLRLVNATLAERFLTAAGHCLTRAGIVSGDPLQVQIRHQRHAVLYLLGRLDEADSVYQDIESDHPDVFDLVGPTELQIRSLTNRHRYRDALTLGLDLLSQFGMDLPAPEQLGEQIGSGLAELRVWVEQDVKSDLNRPEIDDPRMTTATRLINRLMPAAFLSDHTVMAWLTLQSRRIWAEHGPNRHLVGSVAHAGTLTITLQGDYRTGYLVVRRVLDVCQARGYEDETAQVHFLLSVFSAPWFEPLEVVATQARDAFEGSVRIGDLQHAGWATNSRLPVALDFAPSLEDYLADVEACLTFAVRTGNDVSRAILLPYRQFARTMRGHTRAPGSFTDDTFDESEQPGLLAGKPIPLGGFHTVRAVSAAVFGDVPALVQHAQQAMDTAPAAAGMHHTGVTRLVQAMALAQRFRGCATDDERADTLDQLDACRAWLVDRAQDAPMNFSHLVALVAAERAWAVGDRWAAAQAFDTAIGQLRDRSRPWQQALITERAALLHLEAGLEHTGRSLLLQARTHFARWGALAKVAALERQHPFLCLQVGRSPVTAGTLSGVTRTGTGRSVSDTMALRSDAFDLVGVLRASQALSSETNVDRLHDRVVDMLTLMTGATDVHLALWDDESKDWFLRSGDGVARDGVTGGDLVDRIPVEQAAQQGLLPLSAFRYAERTWQPLLVEDATRDHRFARDPALAGLDCCAMLLVPVHGHGATRAILHLQNRLNPAAFTPDRLDAVTLIAGQLAVCLDNALAERFRSLVQRSSELTLVCDLAGTITYASTASMELLGLPESALSGRPLTTLVHIDEQDKLAAWLALAGEARDTQVWRLPVLGQQPRWAELTLTDLSADPAVRGLMIRLRDVTERRRLEVELRHAQKLESVGQLAAGIAHEINTPIQFIDSNVRFLTDAFADLAGLLRAAVPAVCAGPGAAAPEVDDLLDEIPQALRETLDGTARVATIVRAMKAFGHPGGDEKTYADLNETVRTTLVVAGGELRPVADVDLDLADLPPVWCNVGDINQVLLNLVINSVHAMVEKQAVDGGRGTLTVRTRHDGDDILLQVSDTGAGIPAEIADRVFDQFFTTKDVGKGTGQGLALAHTLIHSHHSGSLTFESVPGIGTTFSVRLPSRH